MKDLTQILNIDYPVIMAPMFLVSNKEMILAGLQSGITGAIPALNYRTDEEFREAIKWIKARSDRPFGINLIVNKSNYKYKTQLATCVDLHVDFIITSLGSPKETIELSHKNDIKVFCDVVDEKYALKVADLGADGIIAVNNRAGGHAGPTPMEELIPKLRESCQTPIISAGGIGKGQQLKEVMDLGAAGISMGTVFIASEEATVSQEYKQACVDHGEKDIVMTTKLSGTPCTVINTPYVQKVGTKQNWLERFLNKNRRIKKWFKALTAWRGMKSLKKAAFSSTYRTVWCAGPSIEYVKDIKPVKEIVQQFTSEYEEAKKGNNS